MFGLSALEKKQMIRDTGRAIKQNTIQIRYLNKDFEPNFNKQSKDDYGEWVEVLGTIENISKVNIKKYSYGEINEGDIVFLLPRDIGIPDTADKYEIKAQGEVFVSKTGLIKQEIVGDTFLYYLMVGERR